MADLGYIDEAAKPAENREPLPKNDYPAMIVESDVVATAKGNGEQLKLKMVVVEGPYQNRFLYDQFLLRHSTPMAQEIGQRKMASLRAATGINIPRDSNELHNIPIMVKVKVRPAGNDDNGVWRDARNEVTNYERIGAAAAPAPAYTAPAQRPAATATAVAPAQRTQAPWKR